MDMVLVTPVSLFPLMTLGDISWGAWELVVASLHIPHAYHEFETLYLQPHTLHEAARLVHHSADGHGAMEDVSQCPHPCWDWHQVRC